jgi:hypothetical protein
VATVAIVGSRDYPHEDAVRAYVRSLPPGTEVVSGGRRAKHWPGWRGRGVDAWAADEAERCGLPLAEYEPDGALGVPACFHVRNREMVVHVREAIGRGEAGWVAAFSLEPVTPGTRRTVWLAELHAVPVRMNPGPVPDGAPPGLVDERVSAEPELVRSHGG